MLAIPRHVHALASWLVLVFLATGCAGKDATTPPAAPTTGAAPLTAETFAIHEVDDQGDLTVGAPPPPAGIEIFHEREEPKAGYFYAELPGQRQVLALDRLRAFCGELRVPAGDAVLFGASTRLGVRTYLVRSAAVLEARGVRGAMAVPVTGDEWGVALTFLPDALRSLAAALSRPGVHLRVVVQGLVEKDVFELVDESSRGPIAGPHGSLSTTDWVCSEHRALLTMSTRNGVDTRARAESLARALPPFKAASECHDERMTPRPADRKRTRN